METSDNILNNHKVKEPVQKRAMETRQKIVAAARALFTELGFEQTTTHLIAERSGLSVGGIYAHFKNKEGVFLHILEQRSRYAYQVTLDTVAAIQKQQMPLDDALDFLFQTWYQAHLKHGKLNQEMQRFCLMNETADKIHGQWESAEAEEVKALIQMYHKDLKVDDIPSAVTVLSRATHEVFQYLYKERERVDEMGVLSSLVLMVKKFLTC